MTADGEKVYWTDRAGTAPKEGGQEGRYTLVGRDEGTGNGFIVGRTDDPAEAAKFYSGIGMMEDAYDITEGSITDNLEARGYGEGEYIRESNNELRHCGDGALDEEIIEADGAPHQNQTYWENNVPTPADEIPFAVLPEDYPGRNDMMGCMVAVVDKATGKTVYAVISDSGPAENGWGEVSIKVSDMLDEERGKTHLPSESREGSVEIIAFPDSKPEDWFNDIYGQYAQPRTRQESEYGLNYGGEDYEADYSLLWKKLEGMGMIEANEGVPYDILVSELGLDVEIEGQEDGIWGILNERIQEEGKKYYP